MRINFDLIFSSIFQKFQYSTLSWSMVTKRMIEQCDMQWLCFYWEFTSTSNNAISRLYEGFSRVCYRRNLVIINKSCICRRFRFTMRLKLHCFSFSSLEALVWSIIDLYERLFFIMTVLSKESLCFSIFLSLMYWVAIIFYHCIPPFQASP